MTSRSMQLRRALPIVIVLCLAVGWLVVVSRSDDGPADIAQTWLDAARGAWWASLAYLAVSVARPLILFPATIITVAAGILFGPWWGVVLAVVGSNASALLAYTVGASATKTPATEARGLGERWATRLRANAFETVLVMRLLFLPYDLVNYACGALRIPRRPFIAATALGSAPGTVAFVLAGASIERLDQGLSGLSRTTVLTSVALIVGSIAVSRLMRSRESTTPAAADEQRR